LKITREELDRTEDESVLDLFTQGIRAEATRKKYTRTLKKILCEVFEDVLEGDFETRAAQLVRMAKENPDWVKDLLLNLSKKLKQRTQLPKDHDEYLNPSSVESYFKPIKKLFDMNDVTISWKRIYTTLPELDNISVGRGWTRQEIQRMLNFANGTMDKTIVLFAASSSIRSGAFELSWGDVTPIYKVDEELKLEITESEEPKSVVACAMLRIYRGSNMQYPAFITAEAYDSLQHHKQEWTRQVGRAPEPKDPIFKTEGNLPRRASSAAIKKRVERMVEKAQLRVPLPKGQKRHDVPIMNGFRRFWNKVSKETLSRDSPLASLIKKEYMMGHAGLVKLDRNYFKTHTLELAEEYLLAAPDLTISDEFRLRQENSKLRKEREQYQDSNVIKQLEKRIEELEYGRNARHAQFFKDLERNNGGNAKLILGLFHFMFETSAPEEEKVIAWKKFQQSKGEGLQELSKFLEDSTPRLKNLFSTNA